MQETLLTHERIVCPLYRLQIKKSKKVRTSDPICFRSEYEEKTEKCFHRGGVFFQPMKFITRERHKIESWFFEEVWWAMRLLREKLSFKFIERNRRYSQNTHRNRTVRWAYNSLSYINPKWRRRKITALSPEKKRMMVMKTICEWRCKKRKTTLGRWR
jgi:hypothetical protein